MAGQLRIELFGGLRVLVGGAVVAHFRTRKTAALLAYLAYHRGRPCPREVLIEMLWPWAAPEAGRGSLNTALSWLRQVLEPAGTPYGTALAADRFMVRLRAETVDTDVHEFESELRAVAESGSAGEREARLRQAVALYTGELLAGLYEPWIPVEQVARSERFLEAALELAAILERRAKFPEALALVRRAIEAEPLREGPYRALMRLLQAIDEPAAALAEYRAFESKLERELGVAPSVPTRDRARALERLLRAAPAA